MLSMSGHKLNAQKGIGALYLRRGVTVTPITYGGHHEHGVRPGTERRRGRGRIRAAVELAIEGMAEESRKLSALRDRLERGITASVPNILFNGRAADRLPGTSNISSPVWTARRLLISKDMEGIEFSTGSACSAGDVEPSHVLTAMGIDPRTATSFSPFQHGLGFERRGCRSRSRGASRHVERLRAYPPESTGEGEPAVSFIRGLIKLREAARRTEQLSRPT